MNNRNLNDDTKSIIENHLKQQLENLREIESAISIQERKLSSLPSGMIKSGLDENNNLTYSVTAEDDPIWKNNSTYDRDTIQHELSNLNKLLDAQKYINNSNKEYEDLLSKNISRRK